MSRRINYSPKLLHLHKDFQRVQRRQLCHQSHFTSIESDKIDNQWQYIIETLNFWWTYSWFAKSTEILRMHIQPCDVNRTENRNEIGKVKYELWIRFSFPIMYPFLYECLGVQSSISGSGVTSITRLTIDTCFRDSRWLPFWNNFIIYLMCILCFAF
jgi:hypothetical protein